MGTLFGGTPKPNVPPPPPPPPLAAHPPTIADPGVGASATLAAQRAKAAAGQTVATSPQGLTAPTPVALTSLLGGTV